MRFFPGRAFSPTNAPLAAMRLGFAHLDEAELVKAVDRLARALPPRRAPSLVGKQLGARGA